MDISVIVPSNNRTSYLFDCLKSLLNQTLLPCEVIIVDNSSDPDSNNISHLIDKLRKSTNINLILYKEIRKGASFCRNLGIQKAKGKILAFLDDDCVVDKNWIKNIKSYCHKYPDSVLVGRNLNALKDNIFSSAQYIRTQKIFLDIKSEKKKLISFNYIDTKNFAIPRDVIFENDLWFDERSGFIPFSACEDLDFSIKVALKKVTVIYCDGIIAFHSGIPTLKGYLIREFIKGRAYYYFKQKWPVEQIMKKRIGRFKELILNPSKIFKKPLNSFFLSVLFLLGGLSHKLGIKYESLRSNFK